MPNITFRICPVCGCINEGDNLSCSFCSASLLEVGKRKKNFNPGINPINMFWYGESFHETPEKTLEEYKKEGEETVTEIPAEEPVAEEPQVEYYCVRCKKVYDSSIKTCPKCLHRLKTRPISEFKEETSIEEEASPVVEEKTYTLVLNDKVFVPVKFEDNVFKIGRLYQDYLDQYQFEGLAFTISNEHCFIKREDGEFYLYEAADAPSTNHTYIKKGRRYVPLVPGEEYLIEPGDSFLIFSVKADFVEEIAC